MKCEEKFNDIDAQNSDVGNVLSQKTETCKNKNDDSAVVCESSACSTDSQMYNSSGADHTRRPKPIKAR